jgi:cyclopropane fatty-acyl-phospholipid synthase-like methyltransferase
MKKDLSVWCELAENCGRNGISTTDGLAKYHFALHYTFYGEMEMTTLNDEFPLSAKYDMHWVHKNEMGPNVLWITEALCQVMELKPGMRVLDMGCGTAMSSIFLAKEFDLQVWATDLWISATENFERICEAGLEDCVFPIHAEAHVIY